MLFISRCSFLLPLLAQWPAPAAFPSYRARIPMGTKVACFPGAVGCSDGNMAMGEPASVCHGVGHSSCKGGTLPLNSFGQALEAAGFEWTQELCQADSDGDGQTNGQELGDPCCQWSYGASESPYMKGFSPSHPGQATSSQGDAYTAPACGPDTAPSTEAVRMGAFAPGEEQRYVDLRIKDYAIPPVKTDYVNFVFNFRDNDHDVYHIVFGEAIVDRPECLHHFVVYGCTQRVPDRLEGLPLQGSEIPKSCGCLVGGYTYWNPGGIVWDSPMNAGVRIGAGAHIVGFMVNVHFSDGDQHLGAISRDALRIHYTPDLRSNTIEVTNALFVSENPSMVIPPNAERWFVTRTCEVVGDCLDADESTARKKLSGHTCKEVAAMCGHPQVGGIVMSVCPKSCKIRSCSALASEAALPLSTLWFHGHSLAKEMYLTLTRDGATTDVGSTSVWDFHDHATFPLVSRNLSLKVGDVLQSTCVYNSQSRSTNTVMGHATTDEMCMVSIGTLRRATRGKAPPVAFRCKGDAWSGQLAHGEDALQIADLHPVTQAKTIWSPLDSWESTGDTNGAPRPPTQLCPAASQAHPASCRKQGRLDEDCCTRKGYASCKADKAGRELELVWGEPCNQEIAETKYAYMCCTPAKHSQARTVAPTSLPPSPTYPPAPTLGRAVAPAPSLSAHEQLSSLHGQQLPIPGLSLTVQTHAPTIIVRVGFTVANLRYEDVVADQRATSAFTSAVKESIARAAGQDVTPDDVTVMLAAGSVAVTASVHVLPSSPGQAQRATEVLSSLVASSTTIAESLAMDLRQRAPVAALASGGLVVSEPSVKAVSSIERNNDADEASECVRGSMPVVLLATWVASHAFVGRVGI